MNLRYILVSEIENGKVLKTISGPTCRKKVEVLHVFRHYVMSSFFLSFGFFRSNFCCFFLKNNLKEVKDIPGKDTGSLYVLDVLLNICKNVHLVKKGT